MSKEHEHAMQCIFSNWRDSKCKKSVIQRVNRRQVICQHFRDLIDHQAARQNSHVLQPESRLMASSPIWRLGYAIALDTECANAVDIDMISATARRPAALHTSYPNIGTPSSHLLPQPKQPRHIMSWQEMGSWGPSVWVAC